MAMLEPAEPEEESGTLAKSFKSASAFPDANLIVMS